MEATLSRIKETETAKLAAKVTGPAPDTSFDEAKAFAWATGIKPLEGLMRRVIALEEKEKSLQGQCDSLARRLAALETAARNSGEPHLAKAERR